MPSTPRRSRLVAIARLAFLAALVVPVTASAAAETSRNFEAEATANYVVRLACDDGSTVTQRVTVIAGYDEEQVDGQTTFTNEFLTVRIRSFDCEGNFVNEFATGPLTSSSRRRSRRPGSRPPSRRGRAARSTWT